MNFESKFNVYDKNAIVQKLVARDLMRLVKKSSNTKTYDKVLEIGCGTGIFTRLFTYQYNPKSLILNDLCDTQKYLSDIEYTKFIQADIESISIPHIDIIVSSSVFQWIKDFEKLIATLSKNSRELAFSLYIKDNLLEIKEHFNVSLPYMTFDEIIFILQKYYKLAVGFETEYKQDFKTPLEVLKHLKNTGVTGFSKVSDIKKIRSFDKTSLTYKSACFYAKIN